MRPSFVAAIVTIIMVQVFTLVEFGPADYLNEFGAINFILGFACAILGLLLCVFPKTREIGQGILAGSGILMLVGFATCSVFSNYRPSVS